MSTSDIIATIGVGLLLIAFFLQSIKVLSSTNLIFNLLNFVGAVLTGYSSWLIGFMPLVVLECVWALVSFYGIIKSQKK